VLVRSRHTCVIIVVTAVSAVWWSNVVEQCGGAVWWSSVVDVCERLSSTGTLVALISSRNRTDGETVKFVPVLVCENHAKFYAKTVFGNSLAFLIDIVFLCALSTSMWENNFFMCRYNGAYMDTVWDGTKRANLDILVMV